MGNLWSATESKLAQIAYHVDEDYKEGSGQELGKKRWSLKKVVIVTGGATLVWAGVRYISTELLSQYDLYASLSDFGRHRFDLYALSSYNAAAITAYSLGSLALGTKTTPSDLTRYVACGFTGYFIHDFWATRQEWAQYPADVFHHLLAIGLNGAFATIQPEALMPVYPKFGICESSTLFLNTMWFCRKTGYEGTPLHDTATKLFAATFFASRVVYLPYTINNMRRDYRKLFQDHWYIKYGLYSLAALQVYWFTGILRKIVAVMINGEAIEDAAAVATA
eukprot:TRINITY_DN3205_c1_g1_i2.p1 TRINITY_DN3205_c1_g1~~TRINITY_DN3205_c1_g1_i2.p1  ORF type:complete len:279 (+),score=56.04 TRINITY_DN3205_c1_g1_i2:196-1032(+)